MKFRLPGIVIVLCLFAVTLRVSAQGDYHVLETAAHDPLLFTQGIEIHNGVVYESSGLYGKSKVRKYELESNQPKAEVLLQPSYFAEGLTLLKDTVYVLTWKENTLLMLDPADLSKRGELKYDGEGWGLANDGNQLIMSDGSDIISFRDPSTFEIKRQINVRWGEQPVSRINELEYANGYLWANVWFSSVVLKINPMTGDVAAIYDLASLVKNHTDGSDQRVLNGIAYDKSKKAFWITGKLWSTRYLVELK